MQFLRHCLNCESMRARVILLSSSSIFCAGPPLFRGVLFPCSLVVKKARTIILNKQFSSEVLGRKISDVHQAAAASS